MLYQLFSEKESSTTKKVEGGAMLLKVMIAFCQVYDVMRKTNKQKPLKVNIQVACELNKKIL
jgi:hypothetical protein